MSSWFFLLLQVATAIEELIEEHQRVPGSILRALTERIYEVPKKSKNAPSLASVTNGKCQNGTLTQSDSYKCDSNRAKVS